MWFFTQCLRAALLLAICVVLASCVPSHKVQRLPFTLYYQGQALSCDNQYHLQKTGWQVEQFKFFISDLTLASPTDRSPVALQDSPWQTHNVALLAMDQTGCDPLQQNEQVTFVSDVEWSGASEILFTLGLGFELNHQNPLQQPSPLNQPNMFWSWRNGYKFLRVDLRHAEQAWSFHLGSTGCQSAAPVRAPNAPCVNPNRVSVRLPRPQEGGSEIRVHLDRLLANSNWQQAGSCMFHGKGEEICAGLVSNLDKMQVFEWH